MKSFESTMNQQLKKRKHGPQRGIVLALVVMVLAILSLVGALSMRNATVSEQTTNSLRTAAVAQQAAELGLKYCELVAMDTKSINYATQRAKISATTITAAISSGAWNQTTTWTNAANYISVTGTYSISSDAAAVQLKNAPQCTIEPFKNTSGEGFVVTARGFGNDAIINATNGVTSGAEAWVQSTLHQ